LRAADLRRGDDRTVRPARVELRNRLWQGIQTVSVITGLDGGVDAEALRATLRRLHAVDPAARVLCRLEGSPLRWTPVGADELEAWLHRLVTEEHGSAADDQEAIAAELLTQPPDDRPFTVTVGDGYLGWQVNHVLGDGNYGLRSVVGGLLRATATGEVPTALRSSTESTTRHPLAKATWNSLAREPKLATWRAAVRRGLDPNGRHDQPTVSDDDKTGLSLVARRGPVGTLATLRAWGAEHHPGVSVTLLLMSAARRSLEQHGAVHPTTDSVVMYDLRRYLPSSVDVVGNFSAALRLTDPSCRDPRQVADQVSADVELGLPLVSLMAASATEALSPVWAAVNRPGGQRAGGPVVLSHLGSMAFLRRLPWDTSSGPGQVLTCAAPSIPGGITVCTSEWGKALNVTLTYDSTFVDRDKVVAAAEALVERPWALLEESDA
jgi:hypothetical protein